MSVAQRLARLSQQYPFHPVGRCVFTRSAQPSRCLAYQATASRAVEQKHLDDVRHPPGDSDSRSASQPRPPLFAPLLDSILSFIQRRAQPSQQTSTTPATPPTHASHETTPHTASSTALASSAAAGLDLDDPAISLLFPRLPLPTPPPLHPKPPFPVPPINRTHARQSATGQAAYTKWFQSLLPRTQLHVLLMTAATTDSRFMQHLETVAARKGEAGWEDNMAALSTRRMTQVRLRSKREDEVLEAMWRRKRPDSDWRLIQRGRDKQIAENRIRYWQERWLVYDNRLKSDSGTAERRKRWSYERARMESEIRAHLRLIGMTNGAKMDAKMVELMREARNGTFGEWRWHGQARWQRREQQLHNWKARTVRSLLAEQAKWHEEFARQHATVKRLVVRRRKRRVVTVATELQPIDRSNPPQSFEELLESFCYLHSEHYKLEVWRQRWYITEMAQRAHEQPNLTSAVRARQKARFRAKRFTEVKLLAVVQTQQAAFERQKRQAIRTIVLTHLLPLRSALNGWHVYQLLRSVAGDGQLVGLSPGAPVRTTEELFDSLSLPASPPAPLPSSIAVTPFSWPYMLSFVSDTARATMPTVRVREEEDGSTAGGAVNLVIEVRNVRRDAVVWMYEAMREARAASSHSHSVSWGQVVRVNRGSETEADSDGVQAAGSAADGGGEQGWCVLDMGDLVVQTHSEDDTSGVKARRWLTEDEAKKRLSAVSITRINIITAAA